MSAPEVDRSKFIGGSDISAILGISPWKTPLQLWDEKRNPPEGDDAPKQVRKARERGKRWESAVAEMLVQELESMGHTVEIIGYNKRYTGSPAYFGCEIDFEVKLDGETEITNVELKTVHPFKAKEWGESGTDAAPLWYVAQAMWGLGITARKRCLIAPLFGADEIKIMPVDWDAATVDGLRKKAIEFWELNVVGGIQPEPVSAEDMNRMFPKESATSLLADEELTLAVLRLRSLGREIKAREAEFDTLEFQVKRAMKDNAELLLGDTSAVTWKRRPHSYLDQAALKEDHPKIVREYTVKSESRVFTVKQFGWKGSDQ